MACSFSNYFIAGALQVCSQRYRVATNFTSGKPSLALLLLHMQGPALRCPKCKSSNGENTKFCQQCGGEQGGTNSITVERSDGEKKSISFASGVQLRKGDAIDINTANGGGWGHLDKVKSQA